MDAGSCLICHEANDREDDKASKDTGGTVEDRNDESIAVTIIVEAIIACHGNQGSPRSAHTVEDLHGSLAPHLQQIIMYTIFVDVPEHEHRKVLSTEGIACSI